MLPRHAGQVEAHGRRLVVVRSAYHAEREVTTAAGAIAEAAALACSACSWWRKQNVPIASMALSVHVDLESPLVCRSGRRLAAI
jgi:hypothetical protein